MKDKKNPWRSLGSLKEKMDPECVELVDAVNLFPGIRTTCSCCGHGKMPYMVWFNAKNLKVLPRLLYYFDSCHSGCYGWRVVAHTDCAMAPVTFRIEGPKGKTAYKDALKIAGLLRREMADD